LAAQTILLLIIGISLIGLLAAPFQAWALLQPYRVVREPRRRITLITSGFVHADLGHLLFNLITFYSFAFALQRVIGSVQFAVLYLFGLLVSNLGTTLKHRDDPNYASLGASGAILAVLFASILYFPRQRLFLFPLPLPIPGSWFALGYLALTYYWSVRSRGRINHDAHLAGALAGLVFVALTAPQAYLNFLDALGWR
jgi:membrane associated rhomboid family serine protease